VIASAWHARPVVVGHRGGRGQGWPAENTLAAFEHARLQGAHAVELDARTCAGGQVVVFHDATLPAGNEAVGAVGGRHVSDVGLPELRALGVPTLEDALAWGRSRGVAVNVELKHDTTDRAALVRRTIRAVRATGADALVSSFDPMLLTASAALAPAVPRALLVRASQPLWARAFQRAARPPWVGFVHLERTQAHPRVVAGHLRRGLRVGVWTVNDPGEAAFLASLGVASIITDAPGAILAALTGS
jgi:glycerophosphoryl diester phosphodiesterase